MLTAEELTVLIVGGAGGILCLGILIIDAFKESKRSKQYNKTVDKLKKDPRE